MISCSNFKSSYMTLLVRDAGRYPRWSAPVSVRCLRLFPNSFHRLRDVGQCVLPYCGFSRDRPSSYFRSDLSKQVSYFSLG